MKKYKVTLTDEERSDLQELIAAGKAAAKRLAHARVLLKADASDGGPAWPDARIAEAAELSVATVERIRQRFVEQGLEAALARKKQARPSRQRKLDGAAEARLVALACSHLDHDPTNNRPSNLKAFCQRCHMLHDRPEHQRRRWFTLFRRRALGDLYQGRYQ